MKVLKERLPAGVCLDWNRKDELGRSPLALAALHNNVYMVRHCVSMMSLLEELA